MNKQELIGQIKQKQSYLCVGLDTDIKKIPSSLLREKDPIFEFNRRIIDATHRYAVAYKPNTAFYEAMGAQGWESLQKTLEYIPKDIFTIADAKRGDIGNTSSLYARAFFENMNFDSITVAPYMGEDSVKPFLEFDGKWAIILALTSNMGSKDFQTLSCGDEEEALFIKVLKAAQNWGSDDNIMFVVGATKAEMFATIRRYVPEHFLLVPGVGAQGGDLEEVSRHGLTEDGGLLVNSSRGIIYATSDETFEIAAAAEAARIQQEMKQYLDKYL
jgi:orotidine-5'-phosphate decarboxylase